MKKFLILIAVTAGIAQAAVNNGRPPNPPIPPIPRSVDLDLTLDAADEPVDPPTVQSAAGATGSYAWIYWTMGAAFAAGGVGWYLKEHQEQEPEVIRSEQVFTDDR